MHKQKMSRKDLKNDPYILEAAVVLKERAEELELQKKQRRSAPKEFLLKKRSLSDIAILPQDDFGILLTFALVPYIAGLLFIFLYVFKANVTRLINMAHHHSYPLIWAIGYEIIAGLILLWIAKVLIFSFLEDKNYEDTSRHS